MEWCRGRRGTVAVGCQPKEWMVAVTEQLDEDQRRVRRGSRLARNSQRTGHSRCFSDNERECKTVKLLTEAFPSRVQAFPQQKNFEKGSGHRNANRKHRKRGCRPCVEA